jgi:hypothetical protein
MSPHRDGSAVSPRQLARAAGLLYLINVVCGAFAIGYVNGSLFDSDPAITAANISAHELLYRSGLAAHVVVTVTNVPLALIFYELFKTVNRRVALLAAFFILVATAIEAAGLLVQFVPLAVLGNGADAGSLSAAQLEALSLTSRLSSLDYTVYTVFFAFDILCLSYLVIRSGYLPRVFGILLAIDAVAYLVYSFTDFLAPGPAAGLVPWIQLPAPLPEGGLALWLLIFGVRVEGRTEVSASDTQRKG